MITKWTMRAAPLAVLAAIGNGIFFSPVTQAVTGLQPKTGFLTLGPADFRPDGESAMTDELCYSAGVRLPHSATVTRLDVSYARPAETDALFVILRRVNSGEISPASVAPDAFVPAPVAQPGSVSYSANPAANVVDQQYHYNVLLCRSRNAQFYDARIHYTHASAGS